MKENEEVHLKWNRRLYRCLNDDVPNPRERRKKAHTIHSLKQRPINRTVKNNQTMNTPPKKRRTTIIIIRTTHTFLFNFYLYTRSRYACIWTLGIMETHTALLAAAVVATAVLALLFLSFGRVCVCLFLGVNRENIIISTGVHTTDYWYLSTDSKSHATDTDTEETKERNEHEWIRVEWKKRQQQQHTNTITS